MFTNTDQCFSLVVLRNGQTDFIILCSLSLSQEAKTDSTFYIYNSSTIKAAYPDIISKRECLKVRRPWSYLYTRNDIKTIKDRRLVQTDGQTRFQKQPLTRKSVKFEEKRGKYLYLSICSQYDVTEGGLNLVRYSLLFILWLNFRISVGPLSICRSIRHQAVSHEVL